MWDHEEFKREFDRDWNQARRINQIGLCLTTFFFMLLFACLVSGIIFFVSNA